METRLVRLKANFNRILTIRNHVRNIFDNLQTKIVRLKALYQDFIRANQTQLFVFGLDSFHFQGKLLDLEYDDMQRLFLVINNRMYCEYFKLHKLVSEYIVAHVQDKRVLELARSSTGVYPVYKDLEPFREYKFELLHDIHESILSMLSALESYVLTRQNELEQHKAKKEQGLNIDNFITSFNYSIIMEREKIAVFVTYIEFFHQLHTKYLTRFSNKIQLMYTHINRDIRLDAGMGGEVPTSASGSSSSSASASGLATEEPKPRLRKTSSASTSNLRLGGLCRKESDVQIVVPTKPLLEEEVVEQLFLEIAQASRDGPEGEPEVSTLTPQSGGATDGHSSTSTSTLHSGNVGLEDIFVQQTSTTMPTQAWLEPDTSTGSFEEGEDDDRSEENLVLRMRSLTEKN